ncbi:MAG: SEC-C domain-containing protein [Planctomycetes bacterium]|nr:SEC-C domain-containing protein [Planctomycetota bacterium]
MDGPFAHDTHENWAADFCQSDALTLFPSEIGGEAQSVLATLLTAACARRGVAPTALDEEDLKQALLTAVARLGISETARGYVPSLCRAFLEDLQRQGRIGNGLVLGRYVGALRQAYLEASAATPAPFQRPGAKIGRNDPCPCGSGKKYKKCCWKSDG